MICQWHECQSEADYKITDLRVKPPRFGKDLYLGEVELCGGHYAIAQSLGRLTLDWDHILDAMELPSTSYSPEGERGH